MSRVGKLPVPIPKGVKVALLGKELTVEGLKGRLVKTFHPEINIDVADDTITVTRPSDKKFHRAPDI